MSRNLNERHCASCHTVMLCEQVTDQNSTYRCPRCGLSETLDREGRKLLTGAMNPPGGSPIRG